MNGVIDVNHEPIVHPLWGKVLHELRRSIYAEQVFCSITTEMEHIPDFAKQPALAELHKQNYETSYHRNTACGNLIRMHYAPGETSPEEQRLLLQTIDCFYEARYHDKQAEAAFLKLTASNEETNGWLELAGKWHEQRKLWLKSAAMTLRNLVPKSIWEEGKSQAKLG